MECITAIQIRCEVDGDTVDLSTHTRLHYRVEKRDGLWKIVTMDAVYEKDTMKSAFTDGTFHASREELARFRPTYANMMLRQVKYGGVPNGEMAGEDRPRASGSSTRRAAAGWASEQRPRERNFLPGALYLTIDPALPPIRASLFRPPQGCPPT